ncbi:MAG TPA: aminoacyl-tRNA hydrolase [Planctomycetes bacterium]|nr:aminoacyl-tRNA hydrolase [Planctomycetota bacterium]HIL37722.1 aminoacyl-tRNA hydrolase [Planctomycetota bacterium]
MTRLIVGLGNPGSEYHWTRHNMGFHVVEELAKELGLLFQSASCLSPTSGLLPAGDPGRSARGFEWAHSVKHNALLLKPTTFMNRSGRALASALHFLGDVAPDFDEIFVVYDDLDLELGQLRIRPHGGHGGQNGMRSILEHLDTDSVPRLRVGIGRSGTDAARHVLSPFLDKEMEDAKISVREAAEALLDWLTTGDLSGCMTRFHSRWNC